jgi:hypothetical protein
MVETEVNGDSKSTNERGPALFDSLGFRACHRDFFSALAALVGQVQNIFFLTIQYFNSFDPIGHQAGKAAVLGRLSLFVSLVLTHT